MLVGIYCYIDKKNDDIVYVGKDSNVFKKSNKGEYIYDSRKQAHMRPSAYDVQQINRVLQNNPERYYHKYLIVYNPKTKPMNLDTLEKMYIAYFNPKFNYDEGGTGADTGDNHPWRRMEQPLDMRVKHAKTTTSDNGINILHVDKHKDKKMKQGFIYRYRYREKGKPIYIGRAKLDKLKEEVLRRGLEWIEY